MDKKEKSVVDKETKQRWMREAKIWAEKIDWSIKSNPPGFDPDDEREYKFYIGKKKI